jgi:hypothetical protein
MRQSLILEKTPARQFSIQGRGTRAFHSSRHPPTLIIWPNGGAGLGGLHLLIMSIRRCDGCALKSWRAASDMVRGRDFSATVWCAIRSLPRGCLPLLAGSAFGHPRLIFETPPHALYSDQFSVQMHYRPGPEAGPADLFTAEVSH